jgi:hypothetical protein
MVDTYTWDTTTETANVDTVEEPMK